MPPSYVVGNSVHLNLLTEQERKHLDRSPWVFCLNCFPYHWRKAGFRPTVYTCGDNFNAACVSYWRDILNCIVGDAELRQRLRLIFVGSENYPDEILKHVYESKITATGIPVRTYRRGQHEDKGQRLARSLDEQICHFNSTICNLVNFAAVMNLGEEIRLLGCPRRTEYQYFWSEEKRVEPTFLTDVWEGLRILKDRDDLPLVDCNHHHDLPVEGFPRKAILDG